MSTLDDMTTTAPDADKATDDPLPTVVDARRAIADAVRVLTRYQLSVAGAGPSSFPLHQVTSAGNHLAQAVLALDGFPE